MSVEKRNSEINHEVVPYAQVNLKVIKELRDPCALAVWVYLWSKPKDWVVVKSHLKNHFGFGDGKIKSIFSLLNKCNLIRYQQKTNEGGRFQAVDIIVLNGEKFVNYQLDDNKDTARSKSTRAEKRSNGNSELHIIENTNNRKNTNKRERKQRVPLPNNYEPNDKALVLLYDTSLRVNIDMKALLAKFKNVQKLTKKKSFDWDLEFENFLISEKSTKDIINNRTGYVNPNSQSTAFKQFD